VAGDPVLAAGATQGGEATAMVIRRGNAPGITELGYLTRAIPKDFLKISLGILNFSRGVE
jgi:hypothetical protein